MARFSDLDLNAMKKDLEKKDAEFMAEMQAIRIDAANKINAAKNAMDQVLTELRQFDAETKNAFNNQK